MLARTIFCNIRHDFLKLIHPALQLVQVKKKPPASQSSLTLAEVSRLRRDLGIDHMVYGFFSLLLAFGLCGYSL